jgi:HSP20 family molecular chaperone IbpA
VDPEKINAEQDNGVLTVKIARLKTATPKHIPIRPGKNV